MLQGESHVSIGPILLLGNSICHRSRFAECLHKSRKKKDYNSSHSELGPPVMRPAPAPLPTIQVSLLAG